VRVLVLGPLEVLDGGERPVAVRGARLRALLARLALDAGRPVSCSALVASLWSDEDTPADSANAVQSLVSRLRRVLPDPGVLESGPAGYRLALPAEDVDVLAFEAQVRTARAASRDGRPSEAAESLRAALATWRGPALGDVEAPFAAAEATALQAGRQAALEELLGLDLAAGRAEDVLGQVERLLAFDPLREPAVALQLQALRDAGRPAQALQAYQRYRSLLAEQLGADPSAQLQALHLELLRGEGGAALAPRQSAGRRLPTALTSFLGREDETARLHALLRAERLVTLVGPGGAGKTRLAIEAVCRLGEQVPVTLVELAPVTDPADLPQAVLEALDIREQRVLDANRYQRLDAATRVRDSLEGTVHLLLLDNCEHLVEAAAALAADLLAGCPRLTVLATSREPLAITGEIVFPVPTLPRPRPDATVEQARQSASVQLFMDRARAAAPGFTLDEANLVAVVQTCRRLDGLPLAIELAAARLRSMTVDQLAARLDDRFRLLTGASRTAVARHRTLRAVVEWSWDLLDEPERLLAERFSVFPGGATVEAARAVCFGARASAADTEDALTRLVDRSLLTLVDSPAQPRYRMLETLREFGAERLADRAELAAVRRVHARYFRDLAESAEPALRTADQLAAILTLEVERDNLLAALRFCVDDKDADTSVRIAAALGWYWLISDSHAEAASWCGTALAVPGDRDQQATALVAGLHLVNALASEQIQMSDRARIQELFEAIPSVDRTGSHPLLALLGPAAVLLGGQSGDWEDAIEEGLHHPDPWAKGALHLVRAHVHENAGASALHASDLAEALACFRATGDRWGIATCLQGLGNDLLLVDRLDAAREAYQEALRLFAELTLGAGDEVQLRLRLAEVEHRVGNPERATDLLEQADRAAAEAGSREVRCMVGVGRAVQHLDTGDTVAAAVALGAAEAAIAGPRQVAPQIRALVSAVQARLALATGRPADQVRDTVAEALTLAQAMHDMPVTGMVAETAAAWAMTCDRPQDAAGLLGAAAAMRGIGLTTGERAALLSTDAQVRGVAARAADRLGEEQFVKLYRDLAGRPPAQACAYVQELFGLEPCPVPAVEDPTPVPSAEGLAQGRG
jgi:predicted ATPase/DNA-binding SARP family transcriptional activator